MSGLYPWDEGYEAPSIDAAAIKSANTAKAGAIGQALRKERQEKILSGEIDPNDEEGMKAVTSKLGVALSKHTEENLSVGQKLKYQDFAVEYLRDMDPTLAWIRVGGKPKSAHVRGRQVLRTPYVQGLIQRVVDETEQENLVSGKQIIMALWREGNYFGEDGGAGSRVRALMGLARIKKMDVQVVEKTVKKTHVMQVPMAVDADAWGQAAAQSQAALKSDVRN